MVNTTVPAIAGRWQLVMGVSMEMQIASEISIPFPEWIVAKHNFAVGTNDGAHLVNTLPSQSRAHVVPIVIARDQALDAVKPFENRDNIVEGRVLAGKVAKMPNGVRRFHQGIPMVDNFTVMRVDVALRPHRLVEDADVANVGVGDKMMRGSISTKFANDVIFFAWIFDPQHYVTSRS